MTNKNIIISASRRTDIPAFYMPWFMDCVEKKRFIIKNPYSGKLSTILFTPENIDAVFFWSKNYNIFIKNHYGEKLRELGFELFFHYTINSDNKILEPGIRENIIQRCNNLEKLAEIFGQERIFLRFDPVVFYLNKKNELKNNLDDFEYIIKRAADCKIRKIIISFTDSYKKILKRQEKASIRFVNVEQPKKILVLKKMKKLVEKYNIKIQLCCETIENIKDFAEKKPCISSIYLNKILEKKLLHKKDNSQRSDCLCSKSRDIGSYEKQPCFHNCLYCYANPREI